MTVPVEPDPQVEQDGRFPSGPWTGFFLQPTIPPGKHGMDLKLTFRDGRIRGEGYDKFGAFLIDGRYQVDDGQCWWSKQYVSRHAVKYHGYNEGKGIWGQWTLPPTSHGGFHVWPTAMGDPTLERLREHEDLPAHLEGTLEEAVVITSGADADQFESIEP
ncbi:MAG TPA: hypothetical protein VGZ22_13765 [Isosphaeraceae bacterium]|jgi:hypothetical protein|nr:hypothetical protein [Isosphaeraceae bacterium]